MTTTNRDTIEAYSIPDAGRCRSRPIVAGIYAIQRKDSNECYIGSAVNVANRWSKHRRDLRNGKHRSRRLWRVHDKHGMGVLEFVILEPVADNAQLLVREQAWLDRFKPAYNTATIAGSTLGVKPGAEARAKMSAAHRGRICSAETRAKMSAWQKGKKRGPLSAETRAKISAWGKGRKNGPHSDETRAKLSVACSGWKHTPEARAKISAAQRGEASSSAKLTWARVATIRADSRSCRVVGVEHGVSGVLVSKIRAGKIWASPPALTIPITGDML